MSVQGPWVVLPAYGPKTALLEAFADIPIFMGGVQARLRPAGRRLGKDG